MAQAIAAVPQLVARRPSRSEQQAILVRRLVPTSLGLRRAAARVLEPPRPSIFFGAGARDLAGRASIHSFAAPLLRLGSVPHQRVRPQQATDLLVSTVARRPPSNPHVLSGISISSQFAPRRASGRSTGAGFGPHPRTSSIRSEPPPAARPWCACAPRARGRLRTHPGDPHSVERAVEGLCPGRVHRAHQVAGEISPEPRAS